MITIGNTKYYHMKDVAEALGVTIRTIYTYLKKPNFKARKVGGKWVISESDLKAYIEGKDVASA